MPKLKAERLGEYYQNKKHVVGSEAWLTDEELETKRLIEELEDPNNPRNSEESKAARQLKLDDLQGKPVRSYGNVRG